MKVYLVGGAVRDQLLQLPIKDRDWVVVGATPQQMLEKGYRQVGKDFPVFLHPTSGEEYALARTERKTGKGYTGFDCYAAPDVTLEDDLLRRDLTINAMAKAEDGSIIDPFGGQADLNNRTLRHVSDAFVEDPLRVLRVARFSAQLQPFGFTIACDTKQLLRMIVRQNEMQSLVAERVWLELNKSLGSPAPQQFISVLRECGALAILFPELNNLFGVPNPPHWHPEIDSGLHSLMVLARASELTTDKVIRFAALFHDVGKATSPRDSWPSHIGHGERGVAILQELCKRYPIPNTYSELAILVSRHHIACHRSRGFGADELLELLVSMDAFRRPDRFQQALQVCQADARGRKGNETDIYPQQILLNQVLQAANQVDPKSLLAKGLSGRELGQALHQERLVAIACALENDASNSA